MITLFLYGIGAICVCLLFLACIVLITLFLYGIGAINSWQDVYEIRELHYSYMELELLPSIFMISSSVKITLFLYGIGASI